MIRYRPPYMFSNMVYDIKWLMLHILSLNKKKYTNRMIMATLIANKKLQKTNAEQKCSIQMDLLSILFHLCLF